MQGPCLATMPAPELPCRRGVSSAVPSPATGARHACHIAARLYLTAQTYRHPAYTSYTYRRYAYGVKIARVESFRIGAQPDYEGSAGLRPTATLGGSNPSSSGLAPGSGFETARAGRTALGRNGGRHLCVYPARAEALLVRIVTDDGLVGWGEAHAPPIPRVAQMLIADLFALQLIGRDPLAIDAIWDALYASMRLRGYSTGVMLEALAGVDIALWDVAGKALGQPVYALLGGPYRTRIPCYLSGVPGSTVAERVAGHARFVEEGFRAMKTSIGRGALDEDLEGSKRLSRLCGERRTSWWTPTASMTPRSATAPAGAWSGPGPAGSKTPAPGGRRRVRPPCAPRSTSLWPAGRRSAPAGSSTSACGAAR